MRNIFNKGDYNSDLVINYKDLNMLLAGWGTTYNQTNLNQLLQYWSEILDGFNKIRIERVNPAKTELNSSYVGQMEIREVQLWVNNENILYENRNNITVTAANEHSDSWKSENVIDNSMTTGWHTISDGNNSYTAYPWIEITFNDPTKYDLNDVQCLVIISGENSSRRDRLTGCRVQF